MKHRLAVLFACAALAAAACTESKPPVAAAKPAPPVPAEERVDAPVAAKFEPAEPEGDPGAPPSGEEVKSDAEQIAAFEKRVAK
ncbi:MAG TPA: hypothetical protein VD838_00825 [Anaeromyxobacteraceae bacterium]|nr:hypothetical protein [Anaeromyxobacteraceae bacterium]